MATIKEITLKNGETKPIFPYYTNDSVLGDYCTYLHLHIHIYKDNDSDVRQAVICSDSYTGQQYNRVVGSYGDVKGIDSIDAKNYYYHPERYVEQYTHKQITHIGTIELSDKRIIDMLFQRHDQHIFYYETYHIKGSGTSNRLLDTYIAAFYENWRVSQYRDTLQHFNIFKVCDTCHGSGKVYYKRGKRKVKNIVRKCPQCKGKDNFTPII